MLKLAGIEPDGFVAPAYAYTTALRETLSARFDWWAELLRVHRTDHACERHTAHAHESDLHETGASRVRAPLSPAWGLAAAGPLSRALAPVLVRAGSLLPTTTLRLDVHPADLQHPRHMLALEWVLARAERARERRHLPRAGRCLTGGRDAPRAAPGALGVGRRSVRGGRREQRRLRSA